MNVRNTSTIYLGNTSKNIGGHKCVNILVDLLVNGEKVLENSIIDNEITYNSMMAAVKQLQ